MTKDAWYKDITYFTKTSARKGFRLAEMPTPSLEGVAAELAPQRVHAPMRAPCLCLAHVTCIGI